MKEVKFKPWVWPLLLGTIMTAANIILWFLYGNGEHTLAIWFSITGLILCGIGFGRGLKHGFFKK